MEKEEGEEEEEIAHKFVVRINGPPCVHKLSNISEWHDFMHTLYTNTSEVYDRIGRFIRFITNSVAYD